MNTVLSLRAFVRGKDQTATDVLMASVGKVQQASQLSQPFAEHQQERRFSVRQKVCLPIYVYPVQEEDENGNILIDDRIFDIGMTRNFCSRGVGWRQATPITVSSALVEFNLPDETVPKWFRVEIRWSRQTWRGLNFGGVLKASLTPTTGSAHL